MGEALCRLNGNTVQGAADAGVIVGEIDEAVISGGVLQGNGFGLRAVNGGRAKAFDLTIQNNAFTGIEVRTGSLVNTNATITNNPGGGVFVTHNSTLVCGGCSITGNAVEGVILRRDSTARFFGNYAVTGNTGGAGIELSELSSVYFANAGTVTGNTPGPDVFCGPSFTTARNATTNLGGGHTNCKEP